MTSRQSSQFCRSCGRRTLHAKEVFSWPMGCLLTVLTGLLFLPIWILADVAGILRPPRCQTCGRARVGLIRSALGIGLVVSVVVVLVVALIAAFSVV